MKQKVGKFIVGLIGTLLAVGIILCLVSLIVMLVILLYQMITLPSIFI